MSPHLAASAGASVAWVWSFPLECGSEVESRLMSFLGPEEATRAAGFDSHELRRRFTVAHGTLRLVLSSFTGEAPPAIRILTEPRGKSYLQSHSPHFSLAHTDDVAVVAISYGAPVGVDVERVRHDIGIDEFAPGVLTEDDVARVLALPTQQRLRAWFQAWTVREALAKATGDGLVRTTGVPRSDIRTWELSIDDAHVGALAAAPCVTQVVYAALPRFSTALSGFSLA